MVSLTEHIHSTWPCTGVARTLRNLPKPPATCTATLRNLPAGTHWNSPEPSGTFRNRRLPLALAHTEAYLGWRPPWAYANGEKKKMDLTLFLVLHLGHQGQTCSPQEVAQGLSLQRDHGDIANQYPSFSLKPATGLHRNHFWSPLKTSSFSR